jgi:hypothetical protein
MVQWCLSTLNLFSAVKEKWMWVYHLALSTVAVRLSTSHSSHFFTEKMRCPFLSCLVQNIMRKSKWRDVKLNPPGNLHYILTQTLFKVPGILKCLVQSKHSHSSLLKLNVMVLLGNWESVRLICAGITATCFSWELFIYKDKMPNFLFL